MIIMVGLWYEHAGIMKLEQLVSATFWSRSIKREEENSLIHIKQIRTYSKILSIMIRWALSQRCSNKWMEKGKSNDHFNKCRRSLWHNSTYFKDKNLREFRTRRYILNIIKVTYEEPIVSTILTGGKNTIITLKIRSVTRLPIVHTLV